MSQNHVIGPSWVVVGFGFNFNYGVANRGVLNIIVNI